MSANEMVALMLVLLAVSVVAAVEALLLLDLVLEKMGRRKAGRFGRKLLLPWTVLSLIGIGCVAWAHWVEPFRFEVTHHTIKAASLPQGSRLRILQLSDLHIEGEGPAVEFILKAVEQEQPDVIALTGDYVNNYSAGQEAFTRLLPRLRARQEICAVVGNYDGLDPRALDPRVVTLFNFARAINVGGKFVNIFGSSALDPTEYAGILRAAPKADFTVVLSHTPEKIDIASANGADLYLCGHTHGGQVRLPLYGAVVTLSDTGKRFEAGMYRVGKMSAYVCRGIGTEGGRVPRLRFLCRPEVAVFDVVGSAP